jgi:phytoene dehydrogenase-like protein
MCSRKLHRQGLQVRLLEARERWGVKMHGHTATGTRSPGATALHQFSYPRRLAPFNKPLVKASAK